MTGRVESIGVVIRKERF